MNFYFTSDGAEVLGPRPLSELAADLVSGALPPHTQVCAEGTDQWQSLFDLVPSLSSPPTLPPPPPPPVGPYSPPVAPYSPPGASGGRAFRQRKSVFIGTGCVVQGIGIAIPFLGYHFAGTIGLMAGLVAAIFLVGIGSQMSVYWVCGSCGSRLAGKKSRMCSSCRRHID